MIPIGSSMRRHVSTFVDSRIRGSDRFDLGKHILCDTPHTPMQVSGFKGIWTTAAAASILALFCFRVYSFQPREFFDFYHDDAIYFTTAKALAAGQGYVIPTFPGVLPQTKYPVLYPLMLALIWRIWPAYPANLGPAVAMSIAIAAIYLVFGYLFLRRAGASTAVSLGIVAVIA